MKPEFNNGFITAIALFLEHKGNTERIVSDKQGNVTNDLRLYTATDHLYDLEIPKKMEKTKLGKRIMRWKKICLNHGLLSLPNSELINKIFKEGEDILKAIDEQIFKTKKVVMRYR